MQWKLLSFWETCWNEHIKWLIMWSCDELIYQMLWRKVYPHVLPQGRIAKISLLHKVDVKILVFLMVLASANTMFAIFPVFSAQLYHSNAEQHEEELSLALCSLPLIIFPQFYLHADTLIFKITLLTVKTEHKTTFTLWWQ